MASKSNKRKAPSSQQTLDQKLKTVREEAVEEVEEEEETSDEEEEEEEEVEEEVEEEEEDEEESESESEGEEEEDEEEEEEEESDEEPNDDASKREALRDLLGPFSKSQIIDLLKKAAASDPKIMPKIVQVADSDPTHRKIFIHGLGWDATSEQLLQAFRPFGEIEDSKLVTDKNTGRAKGYAFVLFKTRAAARKSLKAPQKKIGSRMVSCQLAALGPPAGAATAAEGGASGRKMYVGNVGPQVSVEKLRTFFERFGEIEEGPLGMDPATNKFKGFAIITYKTPEGFKKALEEPIKVLENCQLHCKKFVENLNKNNNNVASQSGASTASQPIADASYSSLTANNAGVLGGNLNAGGFMMAPSAGLGLAGSQMLAAGYNPASLAAAGYSPASLAAAGYNPASLAAASGLNTQVAGMGGNYSVIGNYGSQAALHGLGAFQNAEAGQSSVGTVGTTTTTSRAPASGGSVQKNFPTYFRR
ncbi:RNA-binding (RRM/RBD/RNP motifs) family protein [Striga asiatica]|uniref:RNA-binding (RRM/RBD/RNP motifs) family protein n=1 Tax=Striga asiatica TaxID=4170 RepID=A0A5A7R883_STRAF|nr:RNA-binding (RRM/RBD/RNP motifs) family protein [Striga asiatica]